MKTIALFAALLVATVSAQSQSTTTPTSIPYSNPETSFLTQTNSLGVITGQPTLVTSEPIESTAELLPASIYAGLSQGLNTVIAGNMTMTVDVSGSMTSVVTPTPTVAQTTGGSTETSSSNTASATASGKSSGAAAVARMGAGALVGAGAVFAVFL